MAGNDWVNSYLEAILDAGGSEGGARGRGDKSSLLLRERGRFSPARYFVEEVISGFDETDLYKTWVRTAAMRSPEERNTRLENMCWRIWNLARKKKQIESEEAVDRSKRRLERERGRRDATADMSEDLSEGEKIENVNDLSAQGDGTRNQMPRISSSEAIDDQARKLYIVLISIHGLIRGEKMELGRDSDTGGQVKYVVELARALGSTPGVYRVDLLTRQILAPDVDWSYGEPTEMLRPICSENLAEGLGESAGAYIIRIPFGPRDKYIPKEQLWPHIQEFVDGALVHILQMSKALGEQFGDGQPVWPVVIHGHYADAGDSAALLSGALNVPMVFTGHSLGRDKLDQLTKPGRQTREEINATYKIMRRIEGEELCLDASEIVITSTRQEIEEQWNSYDGFNVALERKLRVRMKRGVSCYGRYMPRMIVVPPGMEFSHVVVHDVDMEGDSDAHEEISATPDPPIWSKIMRFFTNRRKPMILALARPDPKKNITTLVKAFGECQPLRDLANLTLIMGNREVIDDMSNTNASVLTSVLKLIDKYDLYGQVAYPKHHEQHEVPDIYRLAARTKGVFINAAFVEPFGLTLIEAAAYGLPIVATKNGGPVDIINVLENGILVDPHDQNSIADALYQLVSNKQLWLRCRQNGLKNIHLFSWPAHCKSYLSRIVALRPRHPQWQRSDAPIISEPDSPYDSLKDIQDISLNLQLSFDERKTDDDGGSGYNSTVKNSIQDAVLKLSKHVVQTMKKDTNIEKTDQASNSNKLPMLRKRKHVFVIAVDSAKTADLIEIIKNIFEASSVERSAGSVGYVLSSSKSISEILTLPTSAGLLATDFDAFICNSGSDLYYPTSTPEGTTSSPVLPVAIDLDYHSQIEYRWGGENLWKTLVRWAAEKKTQHGKDVVIADEEHSTNFCCTFKVIDPLLAQPVIELRRMMRVQAIRSHVLYSHDGSRLNFIPVLASRSQALRYLYIRWEIQIPNMVVFVGESGDTDYEGLLGGANMSFILQGPFNTTASQVHATRAYPLEDVVAFDRPSTIRINGCSASDIKSALHQSGVLKG